MHSIVHSIVHHIVHSTVRCIVRCTVHDVLRSIAGLIGEAITLFRSLELWEDMVAALMMYPSRKARYIVHCIVALMMYPSRKVPCDALCNAPCNAL